MRTRVCKKCGKIFNTETGHAEVYLCPECSLQAKRSSIYRERICKSCGTAFMGYPRSMFCPSCSEERKRAYKKNYDRKHPARPLGSIDHCEICGKEYIVNGGRQRFCPDCAENAVKEKTRAHKREYNRQNKEKISAHKKEVYSSRKVCVICGKVFDSPDNSVTCSPKCAKEQKSIIQSRADMKRRKRITPYPAPKNQ